MDLSRFVFINLIGALVFVKSFEIIENDAENEISERQSRFYPFEIGLVRFENGPCRAASNLTGTCYTRKQCKRVPGIPSGRCAKNVGVCCVVQRSCASTSSANNTYFVNPNFPNAHTGGTRCTITIQRCNAEICQLRLDFLTFILAQPNAEGHCVNDALTITGAASTFTPICGDNTGHHVFLDFNGDQDIVISIETNANMVFSRYWNIRAIQLSCDSVTKAPSGCLMYYTALSGTVKSFNYGSTANTMAGGAAPGTREMANLNYGVCIAMRPDYCAIRWSQAEGSTSFTTTGVTDPTTAGDPTEALQGPDCTTDFVVIPNPLDSNGMPIGTDRFCGNAFTTKTTYSKPFVLTVVTNNVETPDGDSGNRGFALSYQQVRCSGTTAL